MDYSYAMRKSDYGKIDKLNKLYNVQTYWDDVRKLTKNVRSDSSLGSWQRLAELRFRELSGT